MTTTQHSGPDPSWFRGLGLGMFIRWDHADHDPAGFDPTAWADLASRAGVRYIALPTKRPDGFPATAEAMAAFRDRGIRIGLCLSVVGRRHGDDIVGRDPQFATAQYDAFVLDQLDEILTRCGPVDLIWLDGPGWPNNEVRQFEEIRTFIRERRPESLVNDPRNGFGDFLTADGQLPITAPAQPWECRMTMRSSVGCRPAEQTWTSPAKLIHLLVEAAAMGGNLLLEVCPDAAGHFQPEAVERLEAYARWMDRHAESVQGVVPGLALWQFRGPSTRRTGPDGERVYLHLATPPYDEIIVRGMPVRRVRGASTLGDGKALPFTAYPYLKDVRVRTADPSGDVRVDLTNVDLDEAGTVIALDLADAPFS